MQWITLLRASPAAIGRGKIPGGEVRHHVGRALDMTRGIHAQWCEDAAIEEVAEALTADLLHDAAEQHEIRVAVEIARAGGEIQPALPANAGKQILRLAGN